MKRILILLALSLNLAGCSVFMAASGSKDPNLTGIGHGVPRAEVEALLGKPISNLRMPAGDTATYQYFTNDKPNYWRAALYAILDVPTLCLAEFIFFPIEAVQGDKHILVITYGLNQRVLNIERRDEKAPMDRPETYVGME